MKRAKVARIPNLRRVRKRAAIVSEDGLKKLVFLPKRLAFERKKRGTTVGNCNFHEASIQYDRCSRVERNKESAREKQRESIERKSHVS
jgi:hypothetical protein